MFFVCQIRCDKGLCPWQHLTQGEIKKECEASVAAGNKEQAAPEVEIMVLDAEDGNEECIHEQLDDSCCTLRQS